MMETTTIIGDKFIDGDYTVDTHLEVTGSLRVTGFLKVFGCIKAGGHIEAGSFITAGWGITAGEGITAGWGITAGSFIKAGEGITAGCGITAGWGITAGCGITAGSFIKAGEGITAGEDFGIYAGLSVKLSQKSQHAIVSAKEEPCNIQTGTFKQSVDYGWAWHVHHELLAERLIEPIENRIAYIKSTKPAKEIETRLRLLKPMVGTFTTKAELEALHKTECASDCPWNGRTIFSEGD